MSFSIIFGSFFQYLLKIFLKTVFRKINYTQFGATFSPLSTGENRSSLALSVLELLQKHPSPLFF